MVSQKNIAETCFLLCALLLAQSITAAEEEMRWMGNGPTHRDCGLVVARIAEPNAFAAYSKLSGEWTTFAFPKDAKVTPLTADSLIAFVVENAELTQLVAVDQNGQWRTRQLDKPTGPADSPVNPIVGREVAAVRIGNTIHAFSGITGQWDSVVSDIDVAVASDTAMVVLADRLAIFSARTGKWAESPKLADTK
jgi:hypothetical protein